MNERKKKIENRIIRIKSVSRKCHFDSKWTEIPFVVCACWLATPNTKQKTPPNKNRCEIMKKRNGIIKCGCFDKIYDSHCFNWLKWKCVHTASTNKITGQNSSAHVYGWTFNCFAAIFYRFFFVVVGWNLIPLHDVGSRTSNIVMFSYLIYSLINHYNLWMKRFIWNGIDDEWHRKFSRTQFNAANTCTFHYGWIDIFILLIRKHKNWHLCLTLNAQSHHSAKRFYLDPIFNLNSIFLFATL